MSWFHCTNHQKFKASCAVHITRSSPAPTISSLLNSCSGLATHWRKCCANAALLTYIVYKADIETSSRNTVSRCISTPMTPSCTITCGVNKNWTAGDSLGGLSAGHRPVEQSASTQTWPFQNRTHLVSGWIGGTQSKSSNNSHWSVSIPKKFQALHRSEIWEWSSTPAWLHPGKNVFILVTMNCLPSVANNSTGEEKLGRRLCQNISPCTCSLTSGLYCNLVLANVPEVTLAPLFVSSTPLYGLERGDCLYGGLDKPSLDPDDLSNYRPIYVAWAGCSCSVAPLS